MASIKQKSERKYKITVCAGYRSDGKKICKAKTINVPLDVPRKRIAQYVSCQAELFEQEFRDGYSEDADMPFQEYAQRWLARQTKYAPSTLASYRTQLSYVYPLIGHIPLHKLRPVTMENLCMELRKRKHRGKLIQEQTVRKYLHTVSVVLSDAKRNEIIQRNPARMIDLPKLRGKQQPIPDLNEIDRLLEILDQEPVVYRCYYLLALYTGMRRGELCALTWNDMMGIIIVSKSRSHVPGIGIVDGPTKNKKTRMIYLNDWAHSLMKTLLFQTSRHKNFSGEQKVFSHTDGTPYHPDTFSKRLRKIYDKHGFSREYHLHTLRHFFTSYQLQNNISKQVVADIVGHGDTGYLERTYCHPQMEFKAEAADLMSALLAYPEPEPAAG